jgi:hypothetical protein
VNSLSDETNNGGLHWPSPKIPKKIVGRYFWIEVVPSLHSVPTLLEEALATLRIGADSVSKLRAREDGELLSGLR